MPNHVPHRRIAKDNPRRAARIDSKVIASTDCDATAKTDAAKPKGKYAFFQWIMAPCTGQNQIKVAIVSTVVFALLAHLFCWANTMFGHDSLMIVQNDWEHQIAIGRPFAPLYAHVRGEVIAPWLVGSLGTLWLALASTAIVKMLGIRTRAFIAASSGILATCAMVTLCNATYLDWFDLFMFSFLCATLAVSACYNGHKWGVPVGAFLLCFAMGLYQSYLQVSIVLVMAVCLRTLLRDCPQKALRQGLRGFLMVLAGFVLYYLAQHGVQVVTGVDAGSAYNSTAAAFSFDNVSIGAAVLRAWSDPIAYLLFPETHAITLCAVANAVLMILLLVSLVGVFRARGASLLTVALAAVILLLLPLGAGCINIAAYGNVHTLEIQSYFLFYPVVFMALDALLVSGAKPPAAEPSHSYRSNKHPFFQLGCCTLAAVLAFGTLASNIIYANQIYLKKDLEYQATFSTLTRLEAELENLEGYIPGTTPVIVLGALSDNEILAKPREGFPPAASQMLGQPKAGELTDYAVGLWSPISIYASHQLRQYFEYVLGCPIKIVSNGKGVAISDDEAADVPIFPLDGSVTMRDGTAVVRLS